MKRNLLNISKYNGPFLLDKCFEGIHSNHFCATNPVGNIIVRIRQIFAVWGGGGKVLLGPLSCSEQEISA